MIIKDKEVKAAKRIANMVVISNGSEHYRYSTTAELDADIKMFKSTDDYKEYPTPLYDSHVRFFYNDSIVIEINRSNLQATISINKNWKENRKILQEINKRYNRSPFFLVGDARAKINKFYKQYERAVAKDRKVKKEFAEQGGRGIIHTNIGTDLENVRNNIIQFFSMHWAEELNRSTLMKIIFLNNVLRAKEANAFLFWLSAEITNA